MSKLLLYLSVGLMSILFLPGHATAQESININEFTATYPHGNDSLINFIYTNLRWPDPMFCGEGTVVVKITIDECGMPMEYEVRRGIAKIADEEALRVLKLIAKWTPKTENGIPIRGHVYIPVKFRLF